MIWIICSCIFICFRMIFICSNRVNFASKSEFCEVFVWCMFEIYSLLFLYLWILCSIIQMMMLSLHHMQAKIKRKRFSFKFTWTVCLFIPRYFFSRHQNNIGLISVMNQLQEMQLIFNRLLHLAARSITASLVTTALLLTTTVALVNATWVIGVQQLYLFFFSPIRKSLPTTTHFFVWWFWERICTASFSCERSSIGDNVVVPSRWCWLLFL